MRRLLTIPILGVIALASIALSGCGTNQAVATDKSQSGGMMPATDAKERLDEQRLDDATKGLTFAGGQVTANINRPGNRAQAIKATQIAETSYNTQNTWFVAAGLFRDAILADPSYAAPYEGMARSLLLEGKTDLSEAALRTALALDPKFGKAHFELGMVVQMKGDYAGSVSVWKDLVKRDPSYPDTYARMAVASYFAQDFKSAWSYMAEADKRKQNVPSQFRDLLKEAGSRP